MKVLIEVPLKVPNQKLEFEWIENNNNWLFVLEDGKRIRTLSVENDPGKELHSATLAEERLCSSLTWNRDGRILALVIDRNQLYFWEIQRNNFKHFKSSDKHLIKLLNNKKIDFLKWSKVSDKLAICYSSGQILLCNYDSDNPERIIDNSKGVLSSIVSIEAGDELDVFVCVSETSEILIMTYDGEAKFYIQCEDFSVIRAQLSPIIYESSKRHQRKKVEKSFWLTYQSKNDSIFIKRIFLNKPNLTEFSSRADFVHIDKNLKTSLVNFRWIDASNLLTCYSSGIINLIQVDEDEIDDQHAVELVSDVLLSITEAEEREEEKDEHDEEVIFKSYAFRSYNRCSMKEQVRSSVSLAAFSGHKLFYYELLEDESRGSYSFEKVDDLNLAGSLKKVNLELNRVEWCFDCSLLAVQLSNGHILIYKSRLKDYMLAQCNSKIAYLSGMSEITVLNYDLLEDENIDARLSSFNEEEANREELKGVSASSRNRSLDDGNALTVSLNFKPSVIAIGPVHLAAALNNRVRFYNISSNDQDLKKGKQGLLIEEQEYISIVVALSLCSRFVGVYFNDGRLKLHAIQSELTNASELTEDVYSSFKINSDDQGKFDERFFPDPSKPERISAFTLTEELLIYCSYEYKVNVFSLKSWSIVQVFEHFVHFDRPITRLKANIQGNKFVCFTNNETTFDNNKSSSSSSDDDDVFLYDLYMNSMVCFFEDSVYTKIWESQASLELVYDLAKLGLCKEKPKADKVKPNSSSNSGKTRRPKLNQVLDAIWDTDGRTLLLIKRNCIHVTVVLDHTLEREGSLIEFVCTLSKPSSYMTLYASQGIVSFQTSLGRVVNSILESHNDEVKLVKLEQNIQEIIMSCPGGSGGTSTSTTSTITITSDTNQSEIWIARAHILQLKIDYLHSILPIYSLSKCKEICHHLMNDDLFNLTHQKIVEREEKSLPDINIIIWKLLAARALFTSDLSFSLFIYRKHGLLNCARVLREIIRDAQTKSLDTKLSVKSRLLVLLECSGIIDSDDDE